jgi:hypothetical protein
MELSKSAALGFSLLALTSVGACDRTSASISREGPQETRNNLTTLRGIVSAERLTSGSYVFAIDTETGRKAIEVLEHDPTSHEYISPLENVEVLLRPGDEVEIQVPLDKAHKQIIQVTGEQIRVILK